MRKRHPTVDLMSSPSYASSRISRRAIGAFTLAELLLVIGIIGTLAMIAAPRYGSSRASFRSQAAANRIATDLKRACDLARANSYSVKLTFSDDGTSYTTTLDPLGDATIESSLLLSDQPYFSNVTPASLPAGNSITFDGYGQPNAILALVVSSSMRNTSISLDENGHISVGIP